MTVWKECTPWPVRSETRTGIDTALPTLTLASDISTTRSPPGFVVNEPSSLNVGPLPLESVLLTRKK